MNDASPSPETPPPGRRKAPPSPPKPDIAKKAHDLEAIKKALEDATSVGAGFWLSYLFLMFYLAIAAGAVTHVDLLLESPVKLPFLNVELPLEAFFFLAPILFLIVHMFTLSKLVILSDKARRFREELSMQGVSEADQEGLRRQLPSNIFVQGLAGPRSVRESTFGWFLRAMGWISMVFAPVLLLLLLQLQFLPYHESWLTWVHRLALLADLVLLWWLWPKVLRGDGSSERSPKASAALYGAGGASVAALVLAFVVATFPGEWRRAPSPTATDAVFKTLRWPNNTLYLAELNIWEVLKLDDPKKLDWRDHTVNLSYRRLEGANFYKAKLGKGDLRHAQLQGATLVATQLQGASLEDAELQGASLDFAQLQGASLDRAQLQGASLTATEMQGAILLRADLRGASLEAAKLQGASLRYAKLQGASLNWAHLEAASLDEAHIDGATLEGAQLQGVSLEYAKLQGTLLKGAVLQATDLKAASLWRSLWPDAVARELLTTGWLWRPGVMLPQHHEGPPTPWTQERFEALRRSLIDDLPEGKRQNEALKRIESLRCYEGVCDRPSDANAPPDRLENSGVDIARYREALSGNLQVLLCYPGNGAIHILRGTFEDRIRETGPNAPELVEFILSAECPVSDTLTEREKSDLRRAARYAKENYTPSDRTPNLSGITRPPRTVAPPRSPLTLPALQ